MVGDTPNIVCKLLLIFALIISDTCICIKATNTDIADVHQTLRVCKLLYNIN